MTFAEGLIGLIASVCAIIAALIVVGRYMVKRFDRWADALVENSRAVRDLAARVSRLEGTINRGNP